MKARSPSTRKSPSPGIAGAVAAAIAVLCAGAAQAAPRIGYVYPAGGKAGSVIEAEIGGQGLGEPIDAIVSGEGVKVIVREHNRLPAAAVISDYRDKLRELRPTLQELARETDLSPTARRLKLSRLLEEAELSDKKVRQIDQYTRQRNDPKRQLNTQISETVRVRIEIPAGTEPGLRYLRLLTKTGLSNPMRFVVGELREGNEPEAWTFDLPSYVGIKPRAEETPVDERRVIIPPATVNGRILPGEVDEFTFKASKGDQVVIALQARYLVPYLADAVPGWFQAVVSLHDTEGNELAFADDYRFDPDPVIFFKVPADGNYRIRVHDSIYRGREDFVYRITVGELPFLTGVFPLGGTTGSEVDLALAGGNLSSNVLERYRLPETPGIIGITATGMDLVSNAVPFHVDDVDEEIDEREPNNRMGALNAVEPPGLINGSIGEPGDVDFYRIEAGGGRPMTAEIFARRLGSPLDANITVFGSDGKQIAFNDDFKNPAAGLTTHHADARVTVKPPGGGACFVRVADTQHRGGKAYSYRLKITQGTPQVALRATPSSLNARPGGSAQATVHVVRLDGYEGPVELELVDAPEGFTMNSGTIPEGEDSARVSIRVPETQSERPVKISLRGTIKDGARTMTFDVVPAEDMMQAFIYNHLVPVDALLVDVRTPPERE